MKIECYTWLDSVPVDYSGNYFTFHLNILFKPVFMQFQKYDRNYLHLIILDDL